MTDNTDLIAELNDWAKRHDSDGRCFTGDLMRRAADALAARDAACGHLDNQLVAKALDTLAHWWDACMMPPEIEEPWTPNEIDALRAATFEAPGE